MIPPHAATVGPSGDTAAGVDAVWRPDLCMRLRTAQRPTGGWGYSADGDGAAEPTALAALALVPGDAGVSESAAAALDWLVGRQCADGRVPVSAQVPVAGWPTPLAILAWRRATPASATYADATARAVAWLLAQRGEPVPREQSQFDHDTTLVGWSWRKGTHSWIEPTAQAVLALQAADRGAHPRTREGVRLILDRAIHAGGWNYGNRTVLGNALRPFPATTGIALAALQAAPSDARIDAAVAYLLETLPQIRAPWSVGWGVIGLRARGVALRTCEPWLCRAARRLERTGAPPMYAALLLIAGAASCPLLAAAKGENNDAS